MRSALIFAIVVILGVTGFALSEGLRWRREAEAQCQAAKPLVAARAGITELRRLGRGPTTDSSFEESAQLIREFGASSGKGQAISRSLRQGQRVVVFSESNSVMLVFLDVEGKAFQAECFLQ